MEKLLKCQVFIKKAGFAVGIVDKDKIINGKNIKPGDKLIGIASSGIHSNGFSLVRKLYTNLNEEFNGKEIWKTLITPTKIYVKPILRLIEKYDIEVIPLTIRINEVDYKDGVNLTNEEFYKLLRDNKEIPTTSQVTYMTFKETFEKYVKEGKKVLYMAGSSKGSGTYQSAMLAKNDIESDDIYIFDTYSLCIGGGLLVLEAAKMVEEGLDIDTIIKKLEEYKDKVQVYFSVDSLDYLYKGGRISGTKAAVGSLLNIKPILKIEDGLVKQKTQVRGSKKIIPTLIEKLKEEIGDDFSDKDIYVGYGDDLETNEKFVEKVKEELSPKNVYTFRIGSCVACHSGPTVIGIACLNK